MDGPRPSRTESRRVPESIPPTMPDEHIRRKSAFLGERRKINPMTTAKVRSETSTQGLGLKRIQLVRPNTVELTCITNLIYYILSI